MLKNCLYKKNNNNKINTSVTVVHIIYDTNNIRKKCSHYLQG